MPSGCVASVGGVFPPSAGVISYIHDNTEIMGKPIMTRTIINVIVQSGRNSPGIIILHTCNRINAKPA